MWILGTVRAACGGAVSEPPAPDELAELLVGDQVNFAVGGDNPVWSSSEATDSLNGRSGNSVNARFNTPGPPHHRGPATVASTPGASPSMC